MARLNKQSLQHGTKAVQKAQDSEPSGDEGASGTMNEWNAKTDLYPRFVETPTARGDKEVLSLARNDPRTSFPYSDSVLHINESSNGCQSRDSDDDSDGDSDDDSDLSDFIVSDSASEAELRRGARRSTKIQLQTPRRLVRRSPVKRSSVFVLEDSEDEVRVVKPQVAAGAADGQSVSPSKAASDKENLSTGSPSKERNGSTGWRATKRSQDSMLRYSSASETETSIISQEFHQRGEQVFCEASEQLKSSKEPFEEQRETLSSLTSPAGTRGSADSDIDSLLQQLSSTLRLSTSDSEDDEKAEFEPQSTPPRAHLPSKLKSPSKTPSRIPKTPHRPSADAFWDQNGVGKWNEQYSPAKNIKLRALPPVDILPTEIKSPAAVIVLSDSDSDEGNSDIDSVVDDISSEDEGFVTPSEDTTDTAPRVKPFRTPAAPSRTKDEMTARERREFLKTGRQDMAQRFLDRLASTLRTPDGRTIGEVYSAGGDNSSSSSSSSSSSNGISITWSSRYTKSAGMAHHSRLPSSGEPCGRIVLSEKVLTRPQSVYNTVAHEFCHLMDQVISGTMLHGAHFKRCAAAITAAFPEGEPGMPIEITTRHTYEIEYKYVWECDACGATIQRHSKSLKDGLRHAPHTGGRCGTMVQIKPTPRTVNPNSKRRPPPPPRSARKPQPPPPPQQQQQEDGGLGLSAALETTTVLEDGQ